MSDDRMIQVWRWIDAPDELRALSYHGGDEDYVAVVPPYLVSAYLPIFASGTPFGVCDVQAVEHPRLAGSMVFIGAHA